MATTLFFCSIAFMILRTLVAMAQNKVKKLLTYSFIGHVGYLFIIFCVKP
jgi:NADH:ubiquinone oxidoreductase subunit 2 (subunit N)